MEGSGQPPPPPPPGWGPPPGYGHYQPPPHQPDNNPAVVGFVLAMLSLGLLFVSAGLSTIVTIGLGIGALVQSKAGQRKIEAGETTKYGTLAQAGFWCGVAGIALGVLATIAWIVLIVVLASHDLDFDDLPAQDTVGAVLTLLRP